MCQWFKGMRTSLKKVEIWVNIFYTQVHWQSPQIRKLRLETRVITLTPVRPEAKVLWQDRFITR